MASVVKICFAPEHFNVNSLNFTTKIVPFRFNQILAKRGTDSSLVVQVNIKAL